MGLYMHKILIIEDNQLNLDLAKALLQHQGFHTFEAEEGDVGVEMARKILPDIVLLDLNLPRKSGYEVLEELRADPRTKDLQILAFTALAMEEDKRRANACGFNGVITKPINVDTFANLVDSFITNKTSLPSKDAPLEVHPDITPASVGHFSEVMVADSSPVNVQQLTDILISLGYGVVGVNSAKEALEAICKNKPDLLLLDSMLSDKDGIPLLETLKQHSETAEIPVILLVDGYAGNVIESGVFGYLTRPVRPSAIQASFSSVLASKKLQDTLRQKTSEAESAKQDLEQFLFIASHDLQAPLRKIQQFNEFLRKSIKDGLTNETIEYLDGIARNTHDMEVLLGSLLTLSRIERKGAPFSTFSLKEVIENFIAFHQDSLPADSLQTDIVKAPEFYGDRGQIVSVLEILLDNTLKFRAKDKPLKVQIRCRPLDENQCELIFRDNGIGFDPKYIEHIFLPLEKLHGGTKYPGAGMGLAILKKIIERHNGRIEVKSRPGEGTCFRIILPFKY